MLQQTYLIKSYTDRSPINPQKWRLEENENDLPFISLDLGVHLVNLIEFLTGHCITHASAFSRSCGSFDNVIDYVSANLLLNKSIPCNMVYGKSFLGKSNDLKVEIYGDKGSLCWSQSSPDSLLFSDETGGQEVLSLTSKCIQIANLPRYQRFKAGHPTGFIEAFANYYYDLYHKNNEYIFEIRDAIHGLQVLETMHKSARNHSIIEIVDQQ